MMPADVSVSREPPRTIPMVALGVSVLVLDQASKAAAPLLVDGPVGRFVLPLRNHEFTLGLAAASRGWSIVLASLMVVVFGGWTLRLAHSGRLRWWVPPLLIGGALGNLADRIVLGSVRDFLVTPWAVINLADVAVVAGILAYLWCVSRNT